MTELGIALTTNQVRDGADVTALSRAAEAAGLDLVAIGDVTEIGLDPWTLATWVAAATSRIGVGIPPGPPAAPEATNPEIPNPAVASKARQSLDLLAGPRLLDGGWALASPGADADEVRRLAKGEGSVVVPVTTVAEIERLADLLPERARSTRSATARARRRPGIDYDSIPASLARTAVEPGDPAYRSVRSTYMRGGSPGLVLRPQNAREVADALAFARAHPDIPLGIRSAGHGISGRSTNDGGLVIDVGAIDHIEVVDAERRLVRVGPGATWKRVAAALEPHGWALTSGDYGGVGVGGLATAGGIGLLGRLQGLTIDHLHAASIVLADGTLVRASATEHPDLFWAVRGAGANLGVVTEFEFQVDRLPQIGWAQLTFVTTDLEASLLAYGRIQGQAPRDTTVFLVTGAPQQGRSVLQLYGIVASPDPETIVERLNPFVELGQLAQQQVVLTSYRAVMEMAQDLGPDGHHGAGEPVSRSGFLPTLTPDFARDTAATLHAGKIRWFQLRAMGGAIADVAPTATPFTYRDPDFQVTAMGTFQAEMDDAWAPLATHMRGLYLSFDTSPDPDRVTEAFPPGVLARLRELKQQYDPLGLFRDNFPVTDRELIDPGGRA